MHINPPGPLRRVLPGFGGKRLAILFVAWLALFAGINSIPVEDHEAFVLQTAREMNANGDWVLPYFNQVPRLNKPPLNYWFTLGLSRLAGTDIEPWTGRACSMLSGLLLLLATAYTGEKLYGRRAGFLAAVLLLSTQGFAGFSHNARPDFLYSALCVLQLFAWIGAWRSADGTSRQRGLAALGWVLAGLATLTKGPQIPAVFLLGFLLFMLCGTERRRTLKVLRPFSGLVILVALALPWWLLLQQRLRVEGIDLSKTQLSGSLLQTLSDWKEILSFYYVFRILLLLLPVSLLIPLLIFRGRRKPAKPAGVARLILYVSIVTLAVFTVGGHYRPHYMLPLLPLFILLLTAWIGRTVGHPVHQKIWRILLGAGAVALAVCAGLLLWQQQYATLVFLVGVGAVLALLLKKELREPVWNEHPLSAQLVAAALLTVFLFAGFNALPMRSAVRGQDRDFALSVGQAVNEGDYLAAWSEFPDILPYYARHPVVLIKDVADLKPVFERLADGRNIYLVIPQKDLPMLARLFEFSQLTTKENQRKPERTLAFVKILNDRR